MRSVIEREMTMCIIVRGVDQSQMGEGIIKRSMQMRMRMSMNASESEVENNRLGPRKHHRRTTFGAKRNNFFGVSNTSTSISTSTSSPSTIFLTTRTSLLGGSCMMGYVVTLSYDQARAEMQVSKR